MARPAGRSPRLGDGRELLGVELHIGDLRDLRGDQRTVLSASTDDRVRGGQRRKVQPLVSQPDLQRGRAHFVLGSPDPTFTGRRSAA